MKIAYVMSRFPKLTETFVLYEILALERRGVAVEVFPLLRERPRTIHKEAEAVVRRAHYYPFLSRPILGAQWRALRTRPRAYFAALAETLRGTWGSANFFIGAIGIFPKVVLMAEDMQAAGVTHVHAHFATHPALAALIVHRLTGLPFSFTAHGHDVHVDRRMLAQKIEAAAWVATVSSYNRDLMAAECGGHVADRIHVVRCGVDPGAFGPRTFRGPGRPFTIVSVGSLLEVKGHRYLIEACRLLHEQGIDFRCDVVGEGPLRRRLQRQIDRAGLTDRVTLVGARTRDEVARMLAAADVMTLPSVPTRSGLREGIPVALMEAMACGLPVVSSRLSGIPELVGDGATGLLAPPRDAAALADAFQRLHDDPVLARRMGAAGQAWVLAEFNLHRSAEALAGLFAGDTSAAAALAPRTAVAAAKPTWRPAAAGARRVGRVAASS